MWWGYYDDCSQCMELRNMNMDKGMEGKNCCGRGREGVSLMGKLGYMSM